MKRKLFLAVIAVLVICLTCGMLLVACNKDDGSSDDGKRPGQTTNASVDIFKKVVLALGEVKDDTTGTKEFNFGLEITKIEDDSTVFTLAYETLGGKEYFYGATGDGDMMSFKGFDVGGTLEQVFGWFGSSIGGLIPTDPERFVSNQLVLSVLGMLISDASVSTDGNAYSIQLNVAGIEAALDSFKLELPEAVDTVIGVVAPILGSKRMRRLSVTSHSAKRSSKPAPTTPTPRTSSTSLLTERQNSKTRKAPSPTSTSSMSILIWTSSN